MTRLLTITAALLTLTAPAFAQGDADKGESDFRKCKACHAIVAPDGTTIYKGGRTGPDLYGIIGRTAGSVEDFRYSPSMVAAGEAGLVWNEENLAEFIGDPKAFLAEFLDDPSARTKMTFKARNGENVAAYLASVAPAAQEDGASAD